MTRLRIAHFPEHSAINPALDLFADGLRSIGVDVVRHGVLPGDPDRFPTWLQEMRGRLDVVHLHWYQRLYLRDDWAASARALDAMVRALDRVRASGSTVTWTVHNLRPHEQPLSGLDRLAVTAIHPRLDRVFVECLAAIPELVATYPALADRIDVVPSGSYTPVYGTSLDHDAARGALGLPADGRVFLAFGLIRRYKRVPELIETFRDALAGAGHILLVAGEPVDDDERFRIIAAAEGMPDVVLQLDHVPDGSVARVISAATHVVCNYRDSFNSGVVLCAAGLGRGLLAPATGTAADIPAPALIPIGAGPAGLATALRAAVRQDWRCCGMAASAWADSWSWRDAAIAAQRAWSRVRSGGAGA